MTEVTSPRRALSSSSSPHHLPPPSHRQIACTLRRLPLPTFSCSPRTPSNGSERLSQSIRMCLGLLSSSLGHQPFTLLLLVRRTALWGRSISIALVKTKRPPWFSPCLAVSTASELDTPSPSRTHISPFLSHTGALPQTQPMTNALVINFFALVVCLLLPGLTFSHCHHRAVFVTWALSWKQEEHHLNLDLEAVSSSALPALCLLLSVRHWPMMVVVRSIFSTPPLGHSSCS
jgi:hypothetical protein